MNHTNRVVLLIDMDCFYCQVEENLDPALRGKPIAVVQYNQWRGGGIIAVNYPARDRGVTRHMRGNDAKEKCPEIILARVPEVRGKADLTKYRDAGKRVADVLQTFTNNLERASVDEAYLDVTEVIEKRIRDNMCNVTLDQMPNTFVVGSLTADFLENVTSSKEYNESNFKLAMGGIVAEEIRAEVFKMTGYKCSAGIAHNKILAKLVCGLHKPNKQTILPHEAVPELYEKLPIGKIKSLGGKFGNSIAEKLGIEHMGELLKFSQKELAKKFDEKSACWLYNIARGIDMEPVNTRLISKSIGCCKKFPGKSALITREDVEHWLGELAEEISERLKKDFEENNRKAKQMVVSFAQKTNEEKVSGTRTHPLGSYEQSKIFENALKVIEKNCLKADGCFLITFLGISVTNFQDVGNVTEITSFFQNMRENLKKGSLGVKALTNNTSNETPCSLMQPQALVQASRETLDGDISDTNSDLVYWNTTQEEDTDDSDNYVYYQQMNPESITDQSFIDDNMNNDPSDISNDSISPEFNCEPANLRAKEAPANSFFTKYFGENVNKQFSTSQVDRDCDVNTEDQQHTAATSAYTVCTEAGASCDSNGSEHTSNGVKAATSAYTVCNKAASSRESEGSVMETKSSCPECGKAVDYLDYQSHMDYHFALNMVKQEAHLYKPETKKRPSTSTSKPTKPKRKDRGEARSKPIDQFFKTNAGETQNENSQQCVECKKMVRLDGWEVHKDFHAAKKLHMEINVKKVGSTVSSDVNSLKAKGQKDIWGFFKRD